MATNNGTDSPDSSIASPPAVDGDSKMESEKSDCMYPACGPQNDSNSINNETSSRDAESVSQSVPSDLPAKTNQCTKGRAQWCSWTKAFIIILLVALVLLTLFTTVLGWYVIDRLDRLEAQCNSGSTTLLVNNTQLNLELGDDDLRELIANLSKEVKEMRDNISTLKGVIQTVQTTHENDIDQIRMNVSTMLTQVNTSLSNSLTFFTTDAAANISALKREIFSVQNHSVTLAQNVSALLNQISHLKNRSDELEMNAIALESSINEQVTRLRVNVSSNEQLLRAVSATQEEHTTTIEQIKTNISLEDHFDQQLSDMREHLIATLSDFNTSLSLIDTHNRDRLKTLSSHLNNLDNELVIAKEEFHTNMSLLREELTELSEVLDYNITDLSSAQTRLLQDLADIKEIHSGNISALGQSLIHLNEELDETNEHFSSIQDDLRRDLVLTNEAIQYNISALEETLTGEINHTELRLQNQDTELWLNLSATRGRLEANISALYESHRRLQGDVGRTKDNLQTLSSQHINLQSDFNVTKQAFYTSRAAMKQNVSQLHALIQNHSRLLGEAEQSRSTLSDRINQNSNSVRSHGTLISRIRSNMTAVQHRVTGLHDTLTTNADSLNTRIDDHVDWIQHSLGDQSQRLTDIDNRIRRVEQKVESDAVRVVPLGFLLLSAIALLVYILLYTL